VWIGPCFFAEAAIQGIRGDLDGGVEKREKVLPLDFAPACSMFPASIFLAFLFCCTYHSTFFFFSLFLTHCYILQTYICWTG
jgi:hypothetical protein